MSKERQREGDRERVCERESSSVTVQVKHKTICTIFGTKKTFWHCSVMVDWLVVSWLSNLLGFFFQIFKTIKTCSRYVYFHIVHRTLLYLLLLHGAHIIVTVEVYEPDVEWKEFSRASRFWCQLYELGGSKLEGVICPLTADTSESLGPDN